MNRRKLKPCPWVDGKPPHGIIPTRVIVCGTRTFDDYDFLARKMDAITFWFDVVDVVIGGRGTRVERGGEWYWIGADAHANTWAEVNWLTRHFFEANWYGQGKAAGPIRNREMAQYVAPIGFCVAFWDGKSPGTKSMIDEFLRFNPKRHLRVIKYNERKRS